MLTGMHFPAIKSYLEKNTFDILCFQEVGKLKPEKSDMHPITDCFSALQEVLGDEYVGKESIHSTFVPESIFISQSNAIFYKKSFTLLHEDTLWLYKRDTPFPVGRTTFEDFARNAYHLTFSIDGKRLDVVNAHLAWAKTSLEQPHQREQNVKFIDYVSKLESPFILSGDFNIQDDQPTILDLEKYAKDLTKEFGIKNTIDPLNHRNWHDINPGFPVDYIFASPDIKVRDFKALDNEHLSDHYGLIATIEV